MREPDHIIPGRNGPYLRRWYLIPRNRFFNIYLHQFLENDDDRALHDHPWTFNASIVLKGGYREHLMDGRIKTRKPGRVYIRRGKHPHRVTLHELWTYGARRSDGLQPAWTIFITGRVVRSWGFYCPNGWRHWREFLSHGTDGAGEGKGCA